MKVVIQHPTKGSQAEFVQALIIKTLRDHAIQTQPDFAFDGVVQSYLRDLKENPEATIALLFAGTIVEVVHEVPSSLSHLPAVGSVVYLSSALGDHFECEVREQHEDGSLTLFESGAWPEGKVHRRTKEWSRTIAETHP